MSAGQVRAALILERHQTGTYINEQPEVLFNLLVDGDNGIPFKTSTKKIIPLIDAGFFNPGSIIAVSHPDAEFRNVYLLDTTPPHPQGSLTSSDVSAAKELPERSHGFFARHHMRPALAVILMVVAFLIGGLGAPFLVSPHALEHVKLIIKGRSDEAITLDHDYLFEAEPLLDTFASLEEQLGNSQVFDLHISQIWMRATIPTSADADTADVISVEDQRVNDRQPALIQPSDPSRDRFSFNEVDWGSVIAHIPEAQNVATAKGLSEPILTAIRVQRDSTSFARIQITLTFDAPYGNADVRLDANGELLPSEYFEQLPETDRLTMLYSQEQLEKALSQIVETTGSDLSTRIISYGDRLLVNSYVPSGNSGPSLTEVDFRGGRVEDSRVLDGGAQTTPDAFFTLDEVTWSTADANIECATQEFAALGASEPSVSRIIIERSMVGIDEPLALLVRIYVDSPDGISGYVEFAPDGSLQRVAGP